MQATERDQGRGKGSLREFDLRSLLDALHEAGVDFVVIGESPWEAHGFIRGTEDLDIVPDPDAHNLERLSDTLDRLDSTLPTVGERAFDPERDFGVIRRGGNVTAMTRFGGLDVVQRAGVPRIERGTS